MSVVSCAGIWALILAALAALASAAPALARQDLTALVDQPRTEVRRWSDVPAAVRHALERQWDSPAIADPGESFQEYDFPTDGKRTQRRLVLAAKASRAWLVCYEHGGVELSLRLAVVAFDAGTVRGEPAWFGIVAGSDATWVKDLASLRAAIHGARYWEVKAPYF